MVKQLIKKHEKKVRYLIVGAWNTFFGYFSFVFLYFVFRSSFHYTIILVISYIIAITNAYIGYKMFVFKTKGNYIREYFRFYIVYGVAFFINILLLPVAVEILKLGLLLSQAAITFLIIAVSYIGHNNFSFKERIDI